MIGFHILFTKCRNTVDAYFTDDHFYILPVRAPQFCSATSSSSATNAKVLQLQLVKQINARLTEIKFAY